MYIDRHRFIRLRWVVLRKGATGMVRIEDGSGKSSLGSRGLSLTDKSTDREARVHWIAAHFQLNSLLLLPTEASENHSQSCICSYFHLHCPRICLLQD